MDWNKKAHTIFRANYITGQTFNTVPQVIDAGGKLPRGWRDETGQVRKREERPRKREPKPWKEEPEKNFVVVPDVPRIKRYRQKWTEEDYRKIFKMREDGATWRECALAYGITEGAVHQRIRNYRNKKGA